MSKPQRKSPASRSVLGLVPEVESIVPTAAPIAEPEVTQVVESTPEQAPAAPPEPIVVESTQTSARTKKTAPRAAESAKPAEGSTKRVSETAITSEKITVAINGSLKRRAQTAVLRTAAYPNGHQTLASLVEAAIERELAALEADFNRGKPFPENHAGFRTGRPLGS